MNPEHSILLVEDDAVLADMVREYLSRQGFAVQHEIRGDNAVDTILEMQPRVVVLDLGLPGMDGFEVCRRVREDYGGLILVLTAQGDEVDEVASLELGADDFLAKPVRPRVLLARLRALIRRHPSANGGRRDAPVVVGELNIFPGRREVTLQGAKLTLTSAEYDLLYYLATRAGEVVSRRELYEDLRGISYDGLDRSIDLRVSRLRSKLEPHEGGPNLIKSVRGVGYLLALPA